MSKAISRSASGSRRGSSTSRDSRTLPTKHAIFFIAGGQAFGELCNPETRNSLVARRSSAFAKHQAIPVDARNAFAIKSNLLDSETQFKKGIKLMKAGQYADALEQLHFRL